MAEDNLNQNKNQNTQYQANQPAQKLDANGKPIQGQNQGQGSVQKPVAPTADKNAEAAKNRSM